MIGETRNRGGVSEGRCGLWQFFLLMGLIFSPIAAAMAFLITYEEYRHHGFGPGELRRRSLQAAGVTLLFFLLVALAAGIGYSSFAAGP